MASEKKSDEDNHTAKQAPKKDQPTKKVATAEVDQPTKKATSAEVEPIKEKPKERHFVDAETGKTIEKPKHGGSGAATKELRDEMHTERKGNALPFRIGAIVLWVLGLAAEVAAILTANGTLYLPKFPTMTWILIWLVADFVLVVLGAQLWKRANHLSPASRENKLAYWVQTDLGSIIAIIAFAPAIFLLLKNKELDAKTKKVCSIVAGVALVAAVASGIDYHPTTQEDLDQAEAGAAVLSDDGLAYWTPFGEVYHFNPDCQYLKNSGTIYAGTVQDALDANRNRGCSGCAVENGTDALENADPNAVAAAAAKAIRVTDDEASTGDTQNDLPQAA